MKKYHNLEIKTKLIFMSLLFRILSDNKLDNIHDDAFLGLEKLKRLVLHNCGLHNFHLEPLRRLRNIAFL